MIGKWWSAAASAGVSYCDFLKMTPTEIAAANRSYQRRVNYEAWLFGLYIHEALISVVNALFSKKNAKNVLSYPDKPHLETQPLTEEEKKKVAENERLKAIAYMNYLVRIGKKWGKENATN